MNYLSTREIAEKWGITQRRVLKLAREGRIDGARLLGNSWMIPDNAEKPGDGRTRAVKSDRKSNIYFRYPLFLDFDESSFDPSLSAEEKILRRAQIAFHACRFDEADKLLLTLSQRASSRYVKISALYYRCEIAMFDNHADFNTILAELNTAYAVDFPYRKEMLLLRYDLESDAGYYKSLVEDFSIGPEYSYHPSAYYSLLILSLLTLVGGDLSLLSRLHYDTYEILCQQMEKEGHYLKAQELHYMLLIVYQLKEDEERMIYHTRRGLEIAMERKLYLNAALYEQYYPDVTRAVLKGFPQEFMSRICSLGLMLHENLVRFNESRTTPSYLGMLSEKDYKYAFQATQGYTNRQIALNLKVSEKYVSRKFTEIYEKLGVKNKQELVNKITSSHKDENFDISIDQECSL